ncbi:hypothetical protein U1Q18_037383 [Sarracenia purpurea var. burkii]
MSTTRIDLISFFIIENGSYVFQYLRNYVSHLMTNLAMVLRAAAVAVTTVALINFAIAIADGAATTFVAFKVPMEHNFVTFKVAMERKP